MQKVTVEWLKNGEALKDVPDEQLTWLIENSEHYIMKAGDMVFEPGHAITGTHFLVTGRISLFMMQNGNKREVDDFLPGKITGYLPYSRGKIAAGYGAAREDSQVMTLPMDKQMDLIKNHFELTQALVHVMSTRVREFTVLQQQNEKMMALGKLSAGLAHELNNPAAAIVRDSLSLKTHLQVQPETLKTLVHISMDDSQIDAVSRELLKILSGKSHVRLTLKQRSQKEDEITDWLDDNEVTDSYELAENFTDSCISIANLEEFKAHVPAVSLSAVLKWVNNMVVTEKMVEDIQESSRRIEELVCSVKNFTHMDRASDRQFADIHVGINNTLTMLGYKIRKGNIHMVEEYDENLPQVKALIGELNQVWTNLIDNALDAMETNGKGTLTINTSQDREFARISIIDDGPGIPEDALSKVFDPFFTTKDIGKGTGMGLEVVQRIVKQHHGSVKVNSVPGRTEFIVCIPING